MFRKKIWPGGLILVAALFLVGCSQANSTPTLNPEAVYTQAAQTVQAGLTQTAASMPTATATNTPEPTATVTPTLATTPTLSVSPTNTLIPTSTRSAVADKAEWVSQNPADGTVVAPGQPFTLVWTIKNTGTTFWNTNYQVRYYLADATLRFGASDIKFPREVDPNETVDLSLSMKAPSTAGDYQTIWVLTNDKGENFYTLTLTIKVSGAAAATATTAPSATTAPTATSTTAP